MPYTLHYFKLKGAFYSKALQREVVFRLVAPPDYLKSSASYPLLLMNDGQDFQALGLENTLTNTWREDPTNQFIYVGLEANQQRMHEYGTALKADFKGRGGKAGKYAEFIVEELVPFLKSEFRVSNDHKNWVYCGFSLGGLSALDIVLNNPHLFGKAGVFSGSFWWRDKAYDPKMKGDRSRIILKVIEALPFQPHQKFWFQCGTEDEKADRNSSGTIDAIDDTLDVISELSRKGYRKGHEITYVEVPGGKHNQATWGAVFPQFLKWAFGQRMARKEIKSTLKAPEAKQ